MPVTDIDCSPAQLTLNVQLQDDATFDNFLVPALGETLVAALKQQLSAEGEQTIVIHGPPGSGRSHLLQACCHAAGDSAIYWPLTDLIHFDPAEVLEGCARGQQLLCFDDVEVLADRPKWQEALFHLINEARQTGCRLLFAADQAPRSLPFELPDLSSRLSWGTVFALPAVDDAQRLAILQFRAAKRGLSLPDEVARYVLSRAPRHTASLLALLDELDAQSLQHSRALTIQFVKQALNY